MSEPKWQPPTFDRASPIVAEPPSPAPEDDTESPLPLTTAKRVPNIGHALLLGLLTFGMLLASLAGAVSLQHGWRNLSTSTLSPRLQLGAMAFAYGLTLVIAWFLFAMLWSSPDRTRSFLEGIRWNAAAARRNLLKFVPLGFALGLLVQALSSLIPTPKSIPMDEFFRSRGDVLLTAAFGTLLAPLFEEIFFRGFLLPAVAIAYDWLSLSRTPEAILRWQSTDSLSTVAFVFSSIVTSLLFALLHAQQLANTWAAVGLLVCVSLVLSFIRVRTASVACSTLVHACYNLTVFIILTFATDGLTHLDKIQK